MSKQSTQLIEQIASVIGPWDIPEQSNIASDGVPAIRFVANHPCHMELVEYAFDRLLDALLILGNGLAARSWIFVIVNSLGGAEIRLRLLHPGFGEGHLILFHSFLPMASV